MKKTTFLLILIMVALFQLPLSLLGQDKNLMATDQKQPLVVSAGIGYSWGFAVLTILDNPNHGGILPSFYDDQLTKISSTPVITGGFEYGFGKKISLGLAGSYQSFHTGYKISDDKILDFNDIYRRYNISARCLLHFGVFKHFDNYLSFRFGLTIWNLTTDAPNYDYKSIHELPTLPATQIAYGARYFYKNFGIGAEIGIGTAPYIAQANICYRFLSRDEALEMK
jgi:hypothetical protein